VEKLQSVLTKEFNGIVEGKSIYNTLRFQKIKLSPATISLGSQTLVEEHLLRFNRLLLECAYPLEIPKSKPVLGYGELIIDMNGNGDLTDDTVYPCIPPSEMPALRMGRNLVFGPIPCPEACVTGGWDPLWFALIEFPADDRANSGSPRCWLRSRMASYMEAQVQLGRYHTKVAVYDADGDFHLGEPLRGEAGYLADPRQPLSSRGDNLMIDYNQSGRYDALEKRPLSSSVTLAGMNYRLMLCDDLCNLTLETPPQAMVRFNQLYGSDSSASGSSSFAGIAGSRFAGAARIVPGGSAPPQAKAPNPG
jgi:hypothetical protein